MEEDLSVASRDSFSGCTTHQMISRVALLLGLGTVFTLPALFTRRKETDTHGRQPGWLEGILETFRKLSMGSRVWNTYQNRGKKKKKDKNTEITRGRK